MHPLLAIALQCGLALTITLTVVAVWSPAFRRILLEICGTADRADFWLTYSNLMLVVTPVLFTLFVGGISVGEDASIAIIKRGLVPTVLGLFIALAVIGVQIAKFLPKAGHGAAPGGAVPGAATPGPRPWP